MAKKSDDATDSGGEDAKGGKKKLVLVGMVLAAIASAAGVWFFLLRGPAEPEKPKPPEPGVVVDLDAVTINLAGSHYLKLKISLQQTLEVHEEISGAKALDLTIAHFTGRSIDELAKPSQRDALKKELIEKVREAYHDEVYDIYFTEFVMQ